MSSLFTFNSAKVYYTTLIAKLYQMIYLLQNTHFSSKYYGVNILVIHYVYVFIHTRDIVSCVRVALLRLRKTARDRALFVCWQAKRTQQADSRFVPFETAAMRLLRLRVKTWCASDVRRVCTLLCLELSCYRIG